MKFKPGDILYSENINNWEYIYIVNSDEKWYEFFVLDKNSCYKNRSQVFSDIFWIEKTYKKV